ncbi:MAG: hypothetical protein JEZ04_10230 [Spirochaetales bacterium]|nr:hypothetical protein [Spirochaetales bacterium]
MSLRYLTLFRHASAVSTGQESDFDRPLKKKGISKTIENTELIASKGYYPDLVISSSALRAFQTAEVFSETIDPSFPAGEILQFKQLYLPSVEEIYEVMRQIDSVYTDVFLFSHNNGISFFAQDLCGRGGIMMPTGAAVRIEINAGGWDDICPGCGELIDFLP